MLRTRGSTSALGFMLSFVATAVIPGALVGGAVSYMLVCLMQRGMIFAHGQGRSLWRSIIEGVVLLVCLPFVLTPFFLIAVAVNICQCWPSRSPYLAFGIMMVGFLAALIPSFRQARRFNQSVSA